jgi:glycine cleavage system aminomethyltransferase T
MALAPEDLKSDYGDVRSEVIACRTHCALFDFSFLERAAVSGAAAQRALEGFAGRSLATLQIGQIRYALRVARTGEVLADLTIWRTGAQRYELMSGRREDISDLLCLSDSDCCVVDLTARTAVFALQGPQSLRALRGLGELRTVAVLQYFEFCEARLAGLPCVIGRMGYTGEAGFEIIVDAEHRALLWDELARRARPAGFAAADTLRIEAGLLLFANEFVIPVTPSEAGLRRFFDATEYPKPHPIRLVCFRATGDQRLSVWRPVRNPGRPDRAGVIAITSACESPAADGILGIGYAMEGSGSDTMQLRDSAGLFRDLRVVPLPFYDPGKRRPRAAWPD